MKTKAQKQKDLAALTEQFKKAKAAMLVGFQGMTVPKDQDPRFRWLQRTLEITKAKTVGVILIRFLGIWIVGGLKLTGAVGPAIDLGARDVEPGGGVERRDPAENRLGEERG